MAALERLPLLHDESADNKELARFLAGAVYAAGALTLLGMAVLAFDAGATLKSCFAWALLLAGGIAALAAATRWPWHWFALAAAAAHALAAAIGFYLARSAARPAFPITRAEFHKDREWLDTLKSPRKSNN